MPSLPYTVGELVESAYKLMLAAVLDSSDEELALNKQLSLTAHRLDTGANWRVLVLSPAHHRSRLSDSVKNGNALSSVHNAAVPAR